MQSDFRRISDPSGLPEALRGGVVAIGNFDGVHRGHQAVLEQALDEALLRGVPAIVLTFEPHPRTVFQPDNSLFILTPPLLKARLVARFGFDAIIEQHFTREFASHSAEQFVTEVLIGGLGISHAVTGFDFHFGKDRQGGPAFLMASGEKHGFGVTLVDAFRDEGAQVISSSRIRQLLSGGEVGEAAGLLGYRYTVEAGICEGARLGRKLGYPTANMKLATGVALKHGVYAVRFRRSGGELFDGVASFGLRPTVESDGTPLLETHIFDFSGNLYGETCAVSFFGFLRDEEKFDNLDSMVAQIERDGAQARALLSGVCPLSILDQMNFSASSYTTDHK